MTSWKFLETSFVFCHLYLKVENIREFVEHKKKPGEAICAVAETENPAFIVLANRGQSLLRRTFLGSVSKFVVHHSKKTPVLLVPWVCL